jgi:hypothetical protein
VTTTASLIVTAEELPGLTCQACYGPATHPVDVQQGTGTAVERSLTYYVCQADVVRLLAEDFANQGSVVGRLNPTTWSAS